MSPHLTPDAPIELTRWTVTTGSNVNSRAAVVLHTGVHTWDASAEGNGALDALFRAVDRALHEVLDGPPRLVAYDVHALAEGPDAEGRVVVAIAPPEAAEGSRAAGRFEGEATSTNVVAASVTAYVSAINAMLGGAAWAGAAAAAGSRRGPRPGEPTGPHAGAEFDPEEGIEDPTDWFNRVAE